MIRDMDGELVYQSVFLDIDAKKKTELMNQRLFAQVAASKDVYKRQGER